MSYCNQVEIESNLITDVFLKKRCILNHNYPVFMIYYTNQAVQLNNYGRFGHI